MTMLGASGLRAVKPYDVDRGGLHVHAVGEQRLLPGGSQESLFVFDQRVIDPAKRAAGQTAINLRFVHQIHTGSQTTDHPRAVRVERSRDIARRSPPVPRLRSGRTGKGGN